MNQVTIILISYNSENYIVNCINSVIQNTKSVSYDITVVDNASQDNTLNLIRLKFPQIKLIVNKSNYGFAKAVNQAAKESKSEYILLLNPDTVLMNNAVQIFYEYLERSDNKDVACVGGGIFSEDNKPAISYGFFPSLKQIFFEEFGLRKLFLKYYYKKLSPGCYFTGEKEKEVDYICGANLFIRKSVFDLAGCLDEDFFLYYEETELSFRLKKKGYKNMLIPEAKIVHFEGKSVGETNFNILSIKKKSELLFFKKCRGSLSSYNAKLFYLAGALFKFVICIDVKQLKIFKTILKS